MKRIIVIAKEIAPLVIAQELNSGGFFICERKKDAGTGREFFSRKCAAGLTVVSRDLEYIAIGAKRFGSLSGAVRAAKK